MPNSDIRRSRRRLLVLGSAAALVAIAAAGLLLVDRHRSETRGSTASTPVDPSPTDFGTWQAIPEAPIAPRAYAVSAWTGTEAVFWAGSSLSRGFAYTDGAAFDPLTNSWRRLTVPGWGHPGLTSTFFDGSLYLAAKGSATLFDPTNGTWVDLAAVDGMVLAAVVATDDAVWAVGPTSDNPSGQPDLTAARYDPASDTWELGPVFEGTAATADVIAGLGRLETQAVWTGTEIVLWYTSHAGVAFDPVTGVWRTVDPPSTAVGEIGDAELVATDAGVVLLAEVEPADELEVDHTSIWDLAVRVDDGWTWRGSQIPITEPDALTAVAAGEWIVLFSPSQDPITVHVPTGAWRTHEGGPLSRRTAPNAVWTGERLVVWGGVADTAGDDTTADTAPATATGTGTGAIWAPPAG